MSKVAEISSPIRKVFPIHLTMRELIKMYDLSIGTTDSSGEPGEFLRFYDNWCKSSVFKVPSGFIRIEPYSKLGSATIHGMFTGNPFRDSENIKNVLDLYLSKHPEFSHLECHVAQKFHGVKKFVATLAHSSTYRDGKWIFHYGRIL